MILGDSMTTKKNYLEPAMVFAELLKSIKQGRMSEALGSMVIVISTRYANHQMFVRYVHMREEIISNGVLACCKSYMAFRPDKNKVLSRDENGFVLESEPVYWDGEIVEYDYNIHNNPFTFFTTCIKNSNLQLLKKYYKQKNIVNALLVQNGENADYGYEDMMKARQKMLLNADDIDDGVDDEIEMDIDPDLESDLSDDSDIVQAPEMDSSQITCQDDEDDVKSDLRKLGIVW
jgi:hypothetical protein